MYKHGKDIEKAFRKRSLVIHSDKGKPQSALQDPWPWQNVFLRVSCFEHVLLTLVVQSRRADSTPGGDPAEFLQLTAANETLCDPKRRAEYDQAIASLQKAPAAEAEDSGAPMAKPAAPL